MGCKQSKESKSSNHAIGSTDSHSAQPKIYKIPSAANQEHKPLSFDQVNLPTFNRFVEHLQQEYGDDFSELPHTKDTAFVIVQQGFLNTWPIYDTLLNKFQIPREHIFVSTKFQTTLAEIENYLKDTLGLNYVPFCRASEQDNPQPDYDELANRTYEKLLEILSEELLSRKNNKIKKIVICDEGGRFMNKFIDRHCHPDKTKYSKTFQDFEICLVEHTSCGILAEQLNLISAPLISMAKSYAKLKFESPLIARSLFRAIDRQLVELDLLSQEKKQFSVIGLGPIGQAVLSHLIKNYGDQDIKIIVFDNNPEKYQWLREKQQANWPGVHITEASNIKAAVRPADIVLGCAGNNIFKDLEIADIIGTTSETRLISCSSGQREYKLVVKWLGVLLRDSSDIATYYYQADDDKKLYLHNAGFPLNFYPDRSAGLNDSEADLTRSLKLAALVQALQLLHLMPLLAVHPEADKWLKGFIQLAYQQEILSWYPETSENNIAMDQIQTYPGVAMPTEDELLKKDIFDQALNKIYQNNIYKQQLADQNHFPAFLEESAVPFQIGKKIYEPGMGAVELDQAPALIGEVLNLAYSADTTLVEGEAWSGKTVLSHALVHAFYSDRAIDTTSPYQGLVDALKPYVQNFSGIIRIDIQQIDFFDFTNAQGEQYPPALYKFAHFILDQVCMANNKYLGDNLLSRMQVVLNLLYPDLASQLTRGNRPYLLVVDGFEQLNLAHSHAVFKAMLEYSPKIITARPGALVNHARYISQSLVLKGLPISEIPSFIHHFFAARSQEISGEALIDFIRQHKNFDRLLSSPIILRMLCLMWSEYRSEVEHNASINLLSIISVLMQKQIFADESLPSTIGYMFGNHESSNEKLRPILIKLQELAFAMLIKGSRTVTSSQAAKLLGHDVILGTSAVEQELAGLKKIKFFVNKNSFQRIKSYGFEHDLYQDCLAANEVVRLLCSHEPTEVNSIIKWLALNKYKHIYQPIICFVAGLVMAGHELWLWSQQSFFTSRVVAVEQTARTHFWQAMRMHVDIIGQYHFALLVNFLPYISAYIERIPELAGQRGENREGLFFPEHEFDDNSGNLIRHEYDYVDRALLNILRFNFSSKPWNALSLHSHKLDTICQAFSPECFQAVFPKTAEWLLSGPFAEDYGSSSESHEHARYLHRLAVSRLGYLVGKAPSSIVTQDENITFEHVISNQQAVSMKSDNDADVDFSAKENGFEQELKKVWSNGSVFPGNIISIFRELYNEFYSGDKERWKVNVEMFRLVKWFFQAESFYPSFAQHKIEQAKAENSELLIKAFNAFSAAAGTYSSVSCKLLSDCRDRLDLFIETVGAINILKLYPAKWVYFEEYVFPAKICRHMLFGIDPAVIADINHEKSTVTFKDHESDDFFTFKVPIGEYLSELNEFIEKEKNFSVYPFCLYGSKIARAIIQPEIPSEQRSVSSLSESDSKSDVTDHETSFGFSNGLFGMSSTHTANTKKSSSALQLGSLS